VEGYVESAACGLAIGLMLAQRLERRPTVPPPETTALGSLLRHLRRPSERFQPSNVVWSMFPDVEIAAENGVPHKKNKGERRKLLAERALSDLAAWLESFRTDAAMSDDGRRMKLGQALVSSLAHPRAPFDP
jgi:methylenetetrahydrofolate--tRNA-(uracil-5-)-methyltransferase